MTVEVHCDFNTFMDLHDIIENNDADMGNNILALLLFSFQEENEFIEVAAQGDIAEMLAVQLAGMSDAISDHTKHCQLQECLMNHIYENY